MDSNKSLHKIGNKPQQATRYALDIDMYIYANNDHEAKKFAQSIVDMLNQQFDNTTRAKRMAEIPFGSLEPRYVSL